MTYSVVCNVERRVVDGDDEERGEDGMQELRRVNGGGGAESNGGGGWSRGGEGRPRAKRRVGFVFAFGRHRLGCPTPSRGMDWVDWMRSEGYRVNPNDVTCVCCLPWALALALLPNWSWLAVSHPPIIALLLNAVNRFIITRVNSLWP